MSSIKDGIYSLTKPEDNAATIIIASGPSPPNKTILCLPQTYGPEAQWNFKNLGNGNVTIQNVASGKYLGYQGKPEEGRVCSQTDAIEWQIQETKDKGIYNVAVPGGGKGGAPMLVFDIPRRIVFPPMAQLLKVGPGEFTPGWGIVLPPNIA